MDLICEQIGAAVKSIEEKHDAAISRIRALEEAIDELRADAMNEPRDKEKNNGHQ